MEINSGLRSILSHPVVYTSFQYLMGAHKGWTKIVHDYVKAKPGDTILDLGCGPADVLNYLPSVEYWGFDVSPAYIEKAKNKFGVRTHFKCKVFDESDLPFLPEFDVVLLSGLLHHLGDMEAKELVRLASRALKSGGRLVTVDPCFIPQQNPLAHFLIKHDRGQNVRNESGYRALVENVFQDLAVDVVSRTWIPYTHCYMVGTLL